MYRYTILILLAVVGSKTDAQYYDAFEAPVSFGSTELRFPFTGGFENPQFSSSDINNDGLDDIYVFDRNGGVSSVFLRTPAAGVYPFVFTKYYNRFFPAELEGFSLLRDFNGDGVDDIFCSSIPQGAAGVSLYQAERTQDGFRYELRRMGRQEGSAPIIWNRLPSGQVYNAVTDIPAIRDIDGDGDLDILSFDEAGSYVYYCRNNQVEEGLPMDTMDFMIADYCFGKFLESGLSQTIKLSSNPALCASNLSEQDGEGYKNGVHSGSTVTALDADGDSDFDLLLGDLTYNGLVYLENGGTGDAAFMVSTDPTYPSYGTPVNMPVFLASFNLDVNNDGLEDLLVAPNALGSIQNVENIWYYRNTGNAGAPFELESRSFLSDQTIDYGSLSVPSIVDYNADGLMDIVISASGEFNGTNTGMRLVLFENTGSRQSPAFKLVDDNYLDFAQYSSSSSNPAACFGDLDQDGDLDLVIGDEAGKLFYFENAAGAGKPFEFDPPVYNWMDITAGQRIRPAIWDYNKDGLNDLVIGERNTNGYNDPVTGELLTGNINYYQNIGTAGNPLFDSDVTAQPNSPVLGQIRVNFSSSTSARGGAAPYFINIQEKEYMVVGSSGGRLSLYEINSVEPNEPAILIDDRLGGLIEGLWSAPALYDFDDDGLLEILVGNIRGGVSFFKTELMGTSSNNDVDLSEGGPLELYPNPVSDRLNINMPESRRAVHMKVFNVYGQIIESSRFSDELNVQKLPSGFYTVVIEDLEGKMYTGRFVKI